LFAYIGMNINSASRPETRSSIKKANQTFREKENHSRANVSWIGFFCGGVYFIFHSNLLFKVLVTKSHILVKINSHPVFWNQTPRFPPNPAFSTRPRVFHTPGPRTPEPRPRVFHLAFIYSLPSASRIIFVFVKWFFVIKISAVLISLFTLLRSL